LIFPVVARGLWSVYGRSNNRHANLDLPKLFAAETLAAVTSDDAFKTTHGCEMRLCCCSSQLHEEAVFFWGCTSARQAVHENWSRLTLDGWRLDLLEEFS
jgi:hypothetical protein